MKRIGKNLLHLVLALAMVTILIGNNTKTAYAAYETGAKGEGELYTVTFTYDPSTYQGKDQVTSVGFFGSFVFYPSNMTGHTDKTGMMDNTSMYTPHDYQPGMALMSSNYYEEMTYDAVAKKYTLELRLPAGAYIYQYIVNPELGDANPENPMANVLTKDGSFSIKAGTYIADPELVYYYDTPKPEQAVPTCYVGTGAEVPHNPISDETKRGKVSFEPYTDVDGNTRYLGVYLPANYDENADKPYKVIFASHGFAGDETHWFTLLGINNIMDNLIAEGRTDEAIVITMNNTAYEYVPYEWQFETIKENVLNYILPFVEEKYHVSTDPKDRAFCGLSMGSLTTLYMYMNATSSFDYFGAFSGGYKKGDGFDLSSEELKDVKLMIGCGEEDFAYKHEVIDVPTYMTELDKAGIAYTPYFVTGAHDMFTWPQMFAYFADNIVWSKNVEEKASVQDNNDTSEQSDVTVENISELPKTGEHNQMAGFTFLGLSIACLFIIFKTRRNSYEQ